MELGIQPFMTTEEQVGDVLAKGRHALDEAHREEEAARRAFERATPARARILAAQAEGRSLDPDDLWLLELYYRQSQEAAAAGLRFIQVAKQEPAASQPRKVKKESIEVMKIALRVLTSITEKSGPTRDDLDGLLSFAPDLTRIPPDELACEVIQRAMKRQVHLQRALSTGRY